MEKYDESIIENEDSIVDADILLETIEECEEIINKEDNANE